MLTKKNIEEYSDKLEKMKTHLDQELSVLTAEAERNCGDGSEGGLSNAPIHLGDLGNTESEITVALNVAKNEAYLHSEIVGALERMKEGHFGICVTCGKAIAKGRLDAVPYTRYCIRCASSNGNGAH